MPPKDIRKFRMDSESNQATGSSSVEEMLLRLLETTLSLSS